MQYTLKVRESAECLAPVGRNQVEINTTTIEPTDIHMAIDKYPKLTST